MPTVIRSCLVALLALAPSVALAHSELRSSFPVAGSVVSQRHERFELSFNEPVQVTTFRLVDSAETRIGLAVDGSFDATRVESAVNVVPLSPGDYWIDWAAISADGHPISGRIPFQVK